MCVGAYSRNKCDIRWPSRRSHWTKRTFAPFREVMSCRQQPPITFQPLAQRNFTKWDPINPSAPVTNAVLFFGMLLNVVERILWDSVCERRVRYGFTVSSLEEPFSRVAYTFIVARPTVSHECCCKA